MIFPLANDDTNAALRVVVSVVAEILHSSLECPVGAIASGNVPLYRYNSTACPRFASTCPVVLKVMATPSNSCKTSAHDVTSKDECQEPLPVDDKADDKSIENSAEDAPVDVSSSVNMPSIVMPTCG